jgi:S-DNA-T family DNA segregation ATPase FtsK/SpoIIIE
MGKTKKKTVRHYKELYGILFLALGVFFGLCLLSYNPADPAINSASNVAQISNLGGIVGSYLADLLFTILGISAYVLCFVLILMSAMQFMGKTIRVKWSDVIAYSVLIIAASTILHLRFEVVEISNHPISGGGFIGSLLGVILERYLNTTGAYTAATALFTITFFYVTHISVMTFLKAIHAASLFIVINLARLFVLFGRGIKFATIGIKDVLIYAWPTMLRAGEGVIEFIGGLFSKIWGKLREKKKVKINRELSPKPRKTEATLAEQKPVKLPEEKKAPLPEDSAELNPKIYARVDNPKKASHAQLELAHMSKDFSFPSLSLLDSEEQEKSDIDEGTLKKNAVMLRKKLKDYNVEGKITEIHPGPVITMYEFEPAAGVKINKIVNLADDLAVAMGGRSIRIVPHLPGKAAIGIEIPNSVREIVWLKDIIASPKFSKSGSKLTIALGKNTQGSTVISDLPKMPHLLIAGATGSGKSVAINSIICSILYKATPEEVRMIMVDPKKLELSGYNGIPHLLLPVVTQPRQANLALQWALREMEHRYKLLSDVGVKNINSYNSKIEKGTLKTITPEEATKVQMENPEITVHTGKLPFIVIIIDELADLMMVSSKDIEENITRLAQMARAAGIHLIIATQRPSVDVITGLIKANFPTRMAFKVSSKHDSRTILDGIGAEHLLGNGDMLFMPPGATGLTRIHGAYVTESELERVVKHLKEQGTPHYNEEILKPPASAGGSDDEEYDELYDTAIKIVSETRQASISMIQRKLRIGYNRAARMIERMESDGVVGPQDGSKPREVYVSEIE